MKIFAKLDIKKIQYMNLFERITKIKAKTCFYYDSGIIFTVPKSLINISIGRNAINVKVLSTKLNKKVKIIANPIGYSKKDIENFIKAIISHYVYKNISVQGNKIVIYSAPRAKSALIGRDKKRLKQLSDILSRFFRIKEVIIR